MCGKLCQACFFDMFCWAYKWLFWGIDNRRLNVCQSWKPGHTILTHDTMQQSQPKPYLKFEQYGDELFFSHFPESGSFQGQATLHHDSTLPGDVTGSMYVVSCHHAHKDACPLADSHCIWHLFAHRVLHRPSEHHKKLCVVE